MRWPSKDPDDYMGRGMHHAESSAFDVLAGGIGVGAGFGGIVILLDLDGWAHLVAIGLGMGLGIGLLERLRRARQRHGSA